MVELFAAASDLGLHCLPITCLGVSSLQQDKRNGYIFREGNSVKMFLSPFRKGPILNVKNLIPLGPNSFPLEWMP